MNIAAQGNASRVYSSLPSPSFSNITISSGDKSSQSIISNISSGLLIDQFIGLGQSNTLTGDFSAGLDLAYVIDKGKITGCIKDSMIADNLFELLNRDIILSSDTETTGSITLPYICLPFVNYTG